MAVKSAQLTFISGEVNPVLKDLIKEARIMAALGKYRNIVGLIDAHATSTRFFLFMEKGYHDLAGYRAKVIKQKIKEKKLKPLNSTQIRKYTAGILAGIDHMHKKQMFHLDMKPENVIICKADTAKIIDFGLVKTRLMDSKKQMFDEQWHAYGTVGYMPPESWTKNCYSHKIDLIKRDAYAVGMTIFESLLAHYCHWRDFEVKSKFAETKEIVLKRIKHWQGLSRQATIRKKLASNGLLILTDAAAGLIEANPEHRLTIDQALEFIKIDLKQRRRERTMDRDDTLTSMREYHYLRDQLKKSRD
jgi:serine/threonine protein kinase